jgi:hypothetical protein
MRDVKVGIVPWFILAVVLGVFVASGLRSHGAASVQAASGGQPITYEFAAREVLHPGADIQFTAAPAGRLMSEVR